MNQPHKKSIVVKANSLFHFLEIAKKVESLYLERKTKCMNYLDDKGIKYKELERGVSINFSGLTTEDIEAVKEMNKMVPKIDLSSVSQYIQYENS